MALKVKKIQVFPANQEARTAWAYPSFENTKHLEELCLSLSDLLLCSRT